ncbi:MAG: hypothetical protein J6W54_14190 [Fibrobacter sp.]|uniref:hypothetical protein n=1 Tax=Fibrobacter sp. TaxID=35828 RepID=UPI001B18F601|nr:hypothetical protein [Fibrobacter sp.]MBO7062220.1 hypothetical protein [Fibrobacter sp.]
MFYKHWKKIVLALAGFFWVSCDDTSSSPVSVENETPSSSVTGGASSISNATSGNEAASSGEATSAASSTSEPNSVAAESSTSVDNPRSSSSLLDEPIDLYGCPSDICGPFTADSMVALYGVIAAKYGVVAPIGSDSLGEIIAKYGVSSKAACEASQGDNGNTVYKCEDGVTCEEETKETYQSLPCSGDVCPAYGVVSISEKQYKCDNGKVYNEAEFQMYYDAPVNKQDN